MEIVPKPSREVSIFERILFYFSLLFFLFVLFSFIFLFFSVRNLNSQKEELKRRISELETPEIRGMKEELSQLEERFLEIDNLLNSHSFPSHFFPFLESKILKSVILTSLSLNTSGKNAKISGIVEDFPTLSKQLSVFKQSSEIEKAEITSISFIPEGKIKFEISLFFKEELIK